MDNQNQNQKKSSAGTGIIITLVIGLIVGFGAGWYAGKSSVKSGDQGEENGKATTTGAIDGLEGLAAVGGASLAEGDNVAVEDQLAADRVVVKSATLSQLSWLAVRDDNDGVLGNILGAQRLEAGEYQAVAIELLRPTEVGKSYAVVLYADDGDLAFDQKKDKLVEAEGKPFAVAFRAQ